MKLSKGLALLEVVLASILLVGLIYLVTHTTSTYRQHEKAKSLGERLGPVISEALMIDYTPYSEHSEHDLVKETTVCNNSSGVLDNLSPHVLNGFKGSGFSLCNSTLLLGERCDSTNCDYYCESHGGTESRCGGSGSCTSTTTPSCTYTCVQGQYVDDTVGYPCYAVLNVP